jgi:hypothetical protein
VVVDLGDRVVMRPMPDEPVEELRGKYRSVGPDSRSMRNDERDAEAFDKRRV